MNKFSNRGRIRLLTTASATVAAAAMATAANAAQTEVSPVNPFDLASTTADVNGDNIPFDPSTQDAIGSLQLNVSDVLAQVLDTQNGVGQDDSADTQTTITVDANTVSASAAGNIFSHSIDLIVTEDDEDGIGAAALGVSLNSGSVEADADGNYIFSDLDDFINGSLSVSENSISADASGNRGATVLAGQVPNGYSSSLDGSSVVDSSGSDPSLLAEGSLVASTVQANVGDIDAVTGDTDAESNQIYLELYSDVSNTITSAPAVDNNEIASSARGNGSTSLIDIQSGTSPSFTGSAVVTNGQINLGDVEAVTYYSDIGADIDADEGINLLTGTLTVDGNAVTSSASGNESLGNGVAGNRIVIADGMSFNGPGAGADVETSYTNGTSLSDVGADLIIHSSQGTVGAGNSSRLSIYAETYDNDVEADVQALNDGAVSVSDNEVSATARGNTASSAFATGENSAGFSGSLAVANQQTVLYTDVDAVTDYNYIAAYVDDDENEELSEGTVTLTDNLQAANAYGNQVSQTAVIGADLVTLPASGVFLTGGTGPDGNVSAEGGAIVSNLQSIYSADIDATLSEAWIGASIDAEDLVESSVAVTDNTQEAVALGNSGANSLTVSATTLTGGAGIASVQIVADDSEIGASADATTSIDAEDVSGSSLALTDNLVRAIAYGGSSGNVLNVNAETIDVDDAIDGTASVVTNEEEANDGFVLDNEGGELPTVNAAFGLLNDQSTSAQISASVTPYESEGFLIEVYDAVDGGSTLTNEGNDAVAAAYGNDTTNKALLDVGNLTSDDLFAAVLNLTNAQTVASPSNISSVAWDDLVVTDVGFGVDNSSVSTSGNSVQALTYGNRADNEVGVDATNIDNGDTETTGNSAVTHNVAWDETVASVDASFSLSSVQASDGTMSASLVDTNGTPLDNTDDTATWIQTLIGTDDISNIDTSSVVSNGNTLSAGTTGNRADNLLDLAGNTLVTTGALVNYQTSNGDLSALIGIEGSDPTPFIEGTPTDPGYTANYTGQSAQGTFTTSGNDIIITGSITVTFSQPLTQREADYLNGISGVSGATAGGSTASLTGTVDTTNFNNLQTNSGADGFNSGDETFTVAGFDVPQIDGTPDQLATAGSPNVGGVRIAVSGSIYDSTVAVDGNTIAGSVTGNSAANEVAVDVNSAAHANAQISTLVELRDGLDNDIGNDTGEYNEVAADFSLSNVQVTGSSALTSNVYGTLSIDLDYDSLPEIDSSTLSIDDNEQSSRAVGNTANNTVDFSATNTDAGSALASTQLGDADILALSSLDIFVPVAGIDSSVSVSDNTNLSLAVSNNVSNTLTVAGTNLDPVGAERDVRLLSDDNVRAGGDHILANQQIATNDVSATAETTIWNDDYVDDTNAAVETLGIRTSTVTVAGNRTIAEATANRAINTADVSAGSTLSASAGVANFQATAGEILVSATASTNASVNLTGDNTTPLPAINGSTATLGQNTTSSLARGNAATNVLNYAAGSNYGGTTIGSDPYVSLDVNGENTVRARGGVLNNQVNNATISASSEDTSYVIALNGTSGPTLTGATIGVIGNAVSAAAYGNSATNAVTVASLNSNAASVAIGNVQANAGNVTASVTTVQYGVTSGVGAAVGSSIGVNGNAITATAVGNNAVSTIGAN